MLSVNLGDLTKITIEGEVEVAENFFRDTKIMFVYFVYIDKFSKKEGRELYMTEIYIAGIYIEAEIY
jgi:hypothetical protein